LNGGVTHSEPARTAPRRTRPTNPVRPPPRAAGRGTRPARRHGVRGTRHLLNGEDRSYLGSDEDRSSLLDGQDRSYLETDGWPLRGQGAYVLGDGRQAVSPHQQPVPIASVAKAMTAYVVLKPDPLRVDDSGRRFVAVRTMSWTPRRGAARVSRLSMSAPVSSSPSGMPYTDPSGYDDGTVSTALDQLRLAQVVAKDETLAAMMATRTYWLAGRLGAGQPGSRHRPEHIAGISKITYALATPRCLN
jgi:hypothetical protein